MTILDELKQLGELRTAEVIDDKEFAVLKADIISRGCLKAPLHSASLQTLPVSQSETRTALSTTSSVQFEKRVLPLSSNVVASTGRYKLFKPNETQATLHKFFGPSILQSKVTGKSYVNVEDSLINLVVLHKCKVCEKQCKTSAALISHAKVHSSRTSPPRIKPNRGANKRHRYTFSEKVEMLNMINDLRKRQGLSKRATLEKASTESGISVDTLTPWVRDEEKIRSLATIPKNGSLKGVYHRSFLSSLRNLEELLARKIRARRREGLKVKRLWAIATAKQILKMPSVVNQTCDVNRIKLSKSWYLQGFLPRHGFSIRRSTNRKQAEIGQASPTIFAHHTELLKRFQSQPHINPVYGHYAPCDVFNFDQIPLPFVCDGDSRTVDDKGCERVWCRQPGSGLEKRQATAHITMCADDDAQQPKPIIIFRGKGSYIMNSAEAAKWDTRVTVLFQECAWVDAATMLKIVKSYELDPAFADKRDRLLICDNLTAHQDDKVVTAMEEKIGKVFFPPPNLLI